MFCPKCGNQLPDGAQFCSSCGNQINVQPVAPVMPAEPSIPTTPVAPVVPEAPVVSSFVPEAPVVSSFVPETPVVSNFTPEQPVAPVMPAAPVMPETPVMPEAPVMPAAPTFVPEQPAYNNMAMPVTPDANMATAPTKKSKAPLFIGLGIGALLIAIIAIVIVLIATGGDDDDKKPASATGSQTTTSGEDSTTEAVTEETTEEPSTSVNVDVDYDDATDLVEEFMSTLENMDYDDCVDYLYPGMAELLEELSDETAEDVIDDYSWAFYDENGFFFDYEVMDAEEDNDDCLQFYLDKGLDMCDDYDEAYAYAQCEVEFTYKTQKSSVIVRLAYTDDQFYVIDFDDDNFRIVVDEVETEPDETEDPTTSLDEMAAIIDAMINDSTYDYSIVTGDFTGTLANGVGGYTVMLPNDWTPEVNDTNGYTYYVAPSNTTYFTLLTDSSFNSADPVTYLTNFCAQLESDGITVTNLGKLSTPNGLGYYVVGAAAQEDGSYLYVLTYMISDPSGTGTHIVAVYTDDPASSDATIAEYVVSTLTPQ